MMYRIVAIDLDGTLLDEQHRLSRTNHRAIAACIERGIHVVLATGRMFASASPYARALELQDEQITLNGGVFAHGASGRLTPRARLSREQLELVFNTLSELRIDYTVFAPAAIYAEPGTGHMDVLEGYGEPPTIWLPRVDLLALPDPIKVLSFLRPGPLDAELADALGDRIEVIRTGEQFLEFLPPGVSKGAALTELMGRFGVGSDEVLAIGDSENDLSMFAVAGLSVAMANATPTVRARADALTADCRADGVALALEQYVLA